MFLWCFMLYCQCFFVVVGFFCWAFVLSFKGQQSRPNHNTLHTKTTKNKKQKQKSRQIMTWPPYLSRKPRQNLPKYSTKSVGRKSGWRRTWTTDGCMHCAVPLLCSYTPRLHQAWNLCAAGIQEQLTNTLKPRCDKCTPTRLSSAFFVVWGYLKKMQETIQKRPWMPPALFVLQ